MEALAFPLWDGTVSDDELGSSGSWSRPWWKVLFFSSIARGYSNKTKRAVVSLVKKVKKKGSCWKKKCSKQRNGVGARYKCKNTSTCGDQNTTVKVKDFCRQWFIDKFAKRYGPNNSTPNTWKAKACQMAKENEALDWREAPHACDKNSSFPATFAFPALKQGHNNEWIYSAQRL